MASPQLCPNVQAPRDLQGRAGPITHAQRITSLDVLRGVGVLGILVINIQMFSMITPACLNPTAYGDLSGANYIVWLLGHTLVDRKFMAIFSMLFGAGVVLMAARREAADKPAAAVHYRRMALLLLLGLLHAHLLWHGDILYSYAMCGFLIYLFRRCRPATLLIVGLLAIAIPSAISMFSAWSMQYWPQKSVAGLIEAWAPQDELISSTVTAYRGGWLEQIPRRTGEAFLFETFLFAMETLWRAGGLMLVGMALLKLKVLTAERSSATYVAMIAVAVVAGIPIILYGVHRNFAVQWDVRYSLFIGSQYNYWASILVGLGWVAVTMLVCKWRKAQKLIRILAAVGKMSLTNYLLQTVICTTIFFGHGLGFFGQVERVGQILIVLTVWLLQIIVSSVWLRHFRFGPVEWLWRSLTYMKVQPMRRDRTG